MLIQCASEQDWSDAEIRHQIKRLYPMRYMLRRPAFREPYVLWYPWYICPAVVKMDTALMRGQVHADRVAVDSVRPMRERLDRVPDIIPREIDDVCVVPFRLRCEQAREEAHDLLTTVVINRNKLLISHEISVGEPQLVYFRVLIIPVEGLEEDDWPVMEEFFGNSYRLARRRELRSVLKENMLTMP
ncbi:MAG: hypothetical protein JJU41_05715 [Bacteroidetes bacterium]|nr:hypothetical protein [Bacteroidota bacterium]MCH8524354.1 hypothetical protein [Balneolales bacterium]